MLNAEAQNLVEWLSRLLLGRLQRLPGAGQQFLTPAFAEVLFRRVVGCRRVESVGGQRTRLLALSPAVVVDQVEQGRLDVVTEAAAPRVGVAEAAADKTEGKFLRQV